MTQLIKEYHSIDQYQQVVNFDPESLKPDQCGSCGCGHIWHNGQYERAVSGRDKNKTKADQVDILRFKCSSCNAQYSVLPSIIPLLRWYLWCMQQWVLVMVLNGWSFYKVSKVAGIDRRTVSRWYCWLQNKFKIIYHTLCQLHTDFMQHNTMGDFYLSLFDCHSLSQVSGVLHQNQILVPYSMVAND